MDAVSPVNDPKSPLKNAVDYAFCVTNCIL
jgi:hypothetical protein